MHAIVFFKSSYAFTSANRSLTSRAFLEPSKRFVPLQDVQCRLMLVASRGRPVLVITVKTVMTISRFGHMGSYRRFYDKKCDCYSVQI